MTSSSKISPTVAFKDSDTTETVATNANPIIKADAAVAVLSGLRPAFDRAILLGTPNREVGVPRSFVTGSAKYGLSKFMPKKQFNAAAPRIPRSIEVLKSAVSAKTRSKVQLKGTKISQLKLGFGLDLNTAISQSTIRTAT